MTKPGPRDIAHLGGLELFTNKFDESYWFFTELLAMREVGRKGDSVFLRTWDTYENWIIKLTPRDQSGVGNVSLRAASPEALDRVVASIEASGRGKGWIDGQQGVGKSYAFTDPDGHVPGQGARLRRRRNLARHLDIHSHRAQVVRRRRVSPLHLIAAS